MIFKNPYALLLIPIVLALLYIAKRKRRGAQPGIRFPNGELLTGLGETFRIKLLRNALFLRALSLLFIVLAVARPQQAAIDESKIVREGIDIVLSLDVSTSMLAEDFTVEGQRKSRIEAAKEVIREFVRRRDGDRIGLVAFALRPYTVCPLTLDHGWLQRNLARVEVGMMEDSTAIGSGLLAAMNRMAPRPHTPARRKVIVLLTDGRNNAGDVPPDAASEAAKALEMKVYTIGVGSTGDALYPVTDPFGNTVYKRADLDLDEETLRCIAAKTGAAYFRATSAEGLGKIYDRIDRLEKQKIEEKVYYRYRDLFPLFLIPGMLLLLAEFIAKSTILRRLP
ncbi:MAG: VWA domain-containing protein [Deltaproteobacteria bacterium]|nr:VWA domain-containing protein [Deltaproteobacteria bacterium]